MLVIAPKLYSVQIFREMLVNFRRYNTSSVNSLVIHRLLEGIVISRNQCSHIHNHQWTEFIVFQTSCHTDGVHPWSHCINYALYSLCFFYMYDCYFTLYMFHSSVHKSNATAALINWIRTRWTIEWAEIKHEEMIAYIISNYHVKYNEPLTRYVRLRMHRECRERFPRHRLQRKPLVSDPGMHHGTWCGVAEKTFPAFPVHAQPAMLRIWQEAHVSASACAVLQCAGSIHSNDNNNE